MQLSSTDPGQPGLVVKHLASCFPSPLGKSSPRVKFHGLGKAAGSRAPGSSPQIEHKMVKIAHNFVLLRSHHRAGWERKEEL